MPRLHELVMVVAPYHARFYETCFPIRQFGPLRPYPRINGTRVIGLVGDLVMTRALIRVARFGISLDGLVLGFAAVPPEAARRGMERLAAAIEAARPRGPAPSR